MFTLTKRQTVAYDLALSGKKRFILFGGAIRGGKTWWLLITISVLALMYPNSRWVIIRKSLPDLERTTFPSFAQIVERGLKNFIGNWNRSTNVIKFKNRSEILFMSESFDTDKDLDRFKGLEFNGGGMEEINEQQRKTLDKMLERSGTWNHAIGNPPSTILATCNPDDNWVRDDIYDPWQTGSLNPSWTFIESHITDNPYVSLDKIESLKDLPPTHYQRFVKGDWYVSEPVINPFLYSWDTNKHVSFSVEYNSALPVILIFDFNTEPLSVILGQYWRDSDGKHARIFEELSVGNGDLNELCSRIKGIQNQYDIVNARLKITGDKNGDNKQVSKFGNKSHYTLIREMLGLSLTQFTLPGNPTHENSRTDCNKTLRTFNFLVHPRCKETISDCEKVQCDKNHQIIKRDRKIITQRADKIDCVRYFDNSFLKHLK